MPTKFNTSTDSYRVDLDPQVPIEAANPDPVQPSSISTALGVKNPDGSKAITSALNSLFGGPGEDEILGQYAAAATSTAGETSGYATERERILQGLAAVDPKDRKSIEGYYKQLSALRAGERQGASGLSPSVAATRINDLTKSYLVRFPQYATKIRQIHSGVLNDLGDISGVKGGGGGTDPDIQALEELVKNATLNNRSVPEELDVNNAKANADIQKLDMDAKARAGKLTQPDVSASVLSYTNVFYKDHMAAISDAIKNPNFSGKQIVGELHTLMGTVKGTINQTIADIQVKQKILFETDFQDKLVAQAVGPLEELIKMADKVDNPRDRAALSDNLRKISQNSDIATLRKRLGPFATYLQGTPDLVGFAMNAEETMNKIKKGLLPTVRKIAETNVNTRLTLQYLESPEAAQYLSDVVLAMNQGKDPEPTGSPLLDKVGLQGALDAAMAPTTNLDTSEKMLETAARSPHAFEAWERRNDVAKRSRGNPAIIQALEKNSAKLLLEEAHKSGNISAITFNALDLMHPFQVANLNKVGVTDFGPGMRVPGGIYGESLSYTDSNTKNVVDRMNQQYRVFAKVLDSRPQAQKWAADTLDQLNAYAVNGRSDAQKYLDANKASEAAQADPTATEADNAPAITAEEAANFNPLTTMAPGQIGRGTIDLNNRVKVDNEDGTFSTLKSITIEEDGKYILIPTLNPAGKQISDEDAVTLYHYTGDHLGVFANQQSADDFAQALSSYMNVVK